MDASDSRYIKTIVFSSVALVICVAGGVAFILFSSEPGQPDRLSKELENSAYEALKSKNYPLAEQNYKKALEEAENCTDKNWRRARLHGELAALYQLEAKPQQAESEYGIALADYAAIAPATTVETAALARARLELRSKIATTLVDQGKDKDAIAQYQLALNGANDPALSLFDKMHVTRQYAALLRHMHRDQDAAELEADADTMTDYKGHFDHGMVYFLQGNFDQAAKNFNMQLRGARKTHMPDQIAKALTYLALCDLIANHVQQAKSSCQQALTECATVLSDHTRHQRQAEALTVLSVCNQLEGNDRESITHITMAKQMEFGFIFPTLNYLAIESSNAVKPAILMNAVDTVVDRARDVIAYDLMAQLQLSVGGHKEFEKKYKEAEARYLDAIKLYKTGNNGGTAYGLGACYAGMGRLLKAQGKNGQAEEWLEKAVVQYRETKSKYPKINQITGCSIEAALRAAQTELVPVLRQLHKTAQADKVQAELGAQNH